MTERLLPTPDGIAVAAALLDAGEIVAFPTDTVYGVAVVGHRRDRLDALFALKSRPVDRRIPMLVADLVQAVDAGWHADDRARALADAFWPGALTLVLPSAPDLERATDETTQAFRAPDHPVALALIRAAGPLYATSANVSGEPDALGADDVLVAFATKQDELGGLVLGGSVPGGQPSTVLDLSVDPARVLRPGPIGRNALVALVDVAPD